YSEACKSRTGDKNPSYGKSWFYDPMTLKNGKFLNSDIPNGWIKGRIIFNNEKLIKPSSKEIIKSNSALEKNKKIQKIKLCKKCNKEVCKDKTLCRNGQRILQLVENFGFNRDLIGTDQFYTEYERVTDKIKKDYLVDLLSVEDLKIRYGIKHNETMRCILKSLGIERRSLSESVKNFYNKTKSR